MSGPQSDGNAKSDATGDSKTSLPDLERIKPTAFVAAPVRCNVIDPRADEARGNRPKRDDIHVVGIAATCPPAFATKFDRSQHAEGDHQPIHMERTELIR